jgi:hypothetical protein
MLLSLLKKQKKPVNALFVLTKSHSHPWPTFSPRDLEQSALPSTDTRGFIDPRRVARLPVRTRPAHVPKPQTRIDASLRTINIDKTLSGSLETLKMISEQKSIFSSVFIPWPPAVFTCGEKGALPLFESQGSCGAFFLFFRVRAKSSKPQAKCWASSWARS